jgi:hypothetical protein
VLIQVISDETGKQEIPIFRANRSGLELKACAQRETSAPKIVTEFCSEMLAVV